MYNKSNKNYRDISIEEYELETIEKNNIIELYKKLIEEANYFNKTIISNHEKFKKLIEDSKADKIKLNMKNREDNNIKNNDGINEKIKEENENIKKQNKNIKEENEKIKEENEIIKKENEKIKKEYKKIKE